MTVMQKGHKPQTRRPRTNQVPNTNRLMSKLQPQEHMATIQADDIDVADGRTLLSRLQADGTDVADDRTLLSRLQAEEIDVTDDRLLLSRLQSDETDVTDDGMLLSRLQADDTMDPVAAGCADVQLWDRMDYHDAVEMADADVRNCSPSNRSEQRKAECSTPRKPRPAAGEDKSPSRNRRKARWKLKFHHQALPPEYLKHYRQQEKKRIKDTKKTCKKTKKEMEVETHLNSKEKEDFQQDFETFKQRLNIEDVEVRVRPGPHEPPVLENEQLQNEIRLLDKRLRDNECKIRCKTNDELKDSFNQTFLANLLTKQIELNRVDDKLRRPSDRRPHAIPTSGRIRNYSDLPYMGEITLDGIKPRRGRKPKKADICHLIYKNYGQVFPGAPNEDTKLNTSRNYTKAISTPRNETPSPLPSVSGILHHTEVQNRIINSLLERRLTKPEPVEEPLNLCIKDLNSLKIRLSRKHGNVYETNRVEVKEEEVKREEPETPELDSSDDEIAPFNCVTTELGESSDESTNYLNINENVTLTRLSRKVEEPEVKEEVPPVYWPGNNLILHPMALQSQLMYYQQLKKEEQSKKEKQRPPVKEKSPILPKKVVKRVAAKPTSQSVKRKRSAIFIPPLPSDNPTNPSTEVSICKFKFTGGAKPCLQEKKMLRVDAGGNFRYYSGTGDKSMRGYEFFPRESLKQCQENSGCSPAGVFLAASAMGSGEKIPEEVGHSGFFDNDIAIPQLKKPKPEVVVIPEVDEGSDKEYDTLVNLQNIYENVLRGEEALKKVKRSRKSLAREKLEQTFKEKGFLIQTQQLESAEGATYCKFRQLRKFTRYLFRSWKDYLPGNVQELSGDRAIEGDLLPDIPLCLSPTADSSELQDSNL